MLAAALRTLGRELARTFVPSWCVVCRGELPWRDRVASCCASCWSELPRVTVPLCTSCAQPLPVTADGLRCLDCQENPSPLEWCDAWGHYRGGLDPLLQAFKFSRHHFLADPLGGLLAERLNERGDLAFDTVVPVPMARAKHRRRGYNQAELLARSLAQRVALVCRTDVLTKTAERETQSTLTRDARAANVRNVFAASQAAKGLSILLVDDICTTGQTLRACATALMRRRAARVCAIVVAKAS